MNELYLSTEIYSVEIIKAAIRQFASLSDINLITESSYYKCIFSECIYDTEETMKEFENYIIDSMNSGNAL